MKTLFGMSTRFCNTEASRFQNCPTACSVKCHNKNETTADIMNDIGKNI